MYARCPHILRVLHVLSIQSFIFSACPSLHLLLHYVFTHLVSQVVTTSRQASRPHRAAASAAASVQLGVYPPGSQTTPCHGRRLRADAPHGSSAHLAVSTLLLMRWWLGCLLCAEESRGGDETEGEGGETKDKLDEMTDGCPVWLGGRVEKRKPSGEEKMVRMFAEPSVLWAGEYYEMDSASICSLLSLDS
ncbi:hypothetical protein IWZ00DRAFT_182274 [Phyllosticta capitalensis]